MPPPQIRPTNNTSWTNRHETFTQPISNLFDVINGSNGNIFADYNATTEAIQGFLGRAINENKTVRALGGGWSFTKIAATDGWILNTKNMNMLFPVRKKESLSQDYPGSPDQVLFAQCGNSIQELNKWLKTNNRSLKTSGASNGQTIVGCFSTGTHGSAMDTGSVQDFIVGMHIILGPDKHVWLEKKSRPVVSDIFLQKFNITEPPIRDDDMFNSAIVSFGSFGFIHGVMLETDNIYLLECYRKKIPVDDVLKNVMKTLDFSNTNFTPLGNERPFHFQAVIDQYNIGDGAYATIMYKRPLTNYDPPVVDVDKAGPGDDLPAVVGIITDLFPAITHLLVSNLVKSTYSLYDGVRGTSGEIFTNNNIRGKVLSTAVGIPLDRVLEVNDMLIELNDSIKFTGVFSYRYVKKSPAILAFTKFAPTCILELDGVTSGTTTDFYNAMWDELDARDIPYTFHWGKVNNLNAGKVDKMYGADKTKWVEQRNKLMSPASMRVFNNQTLKNWGLDEIIPRGF